MPGRNEGRLPDRHRSGHPGFVPYEAFDTADAPLLMCCGNDRLFAKLAAELGRRRLGDRPTVQPSNRARLSNKAALMAQLQPLLRAQPRAAWITRFEAAGVPCAPVHTVPEALAHPQVQALDMLHTVPGEDFSLTAAAAHHRWPAKPGPRATAPQLGQHNPANGVPLNAPAAPPFRP